MSKAPTLTRDAVLGAEDRKVVPVAVPEWGGVVHVRVMSGAERDRWELEQADAPREDVRARLVAHAACDESGAPLFDPEDVAALSAKSGAALQRLFSAAMRINKVTAADVDELEGNSAAGR